MACCTLEQCLWGVCDVLGRPMYTMTEGSLDLGWVMASQLHTVLSMIAVLASS